MRAMNDASTEQNKGFFARLRHRLNNGKGLGFGGFGWLAGRNFDESVAEEIEERLLLADAGVDATHRIVAGIQKRTDKVDASAISQALRSELVELLEPLASPLEIPSTVRPFVILMIGVNGSGKTTTIGKLAYRFKEQGLSVLLAAGDTYRAAAREQLEAWGAANDVPVIAQAPGADPAAVIFDALEAAQARNIDVVLADTAGRLQSHDSLMRELEKIVRVAGKSDAAAPHEIMLVLDASLGQNALSQARQFNEAVGLTGITLTKLDGGARGGILLAIAHELDIPFRFIGVGEQADDMAPFNAERFVDALLDAEQTG